MLLLLFLHGLRCFASAVNVYIRISFITAHALKQHNLFISSQISPIFAIACAISVDKRVTESHLSVMAALDEELGGDLEPVKIPFTSGARNVIAVRSVQ